jgi:hypothetical protein
MRRIAVVLVVGLVLVASATSYAQIAVFDAAVTFRNSVTATLEQYLLLVEQQQHARLRQMARRLSALTDIRKYATLDPPRWRTHGGDFIYANGINDALIFGDTNGAAYGAVSHPVVDPQAYLASLPAAARRLVASRLATLDAADASEVAGINDTGLLRFNGRKQEMPAIDALETQVIDPSDDQSATAVLDKISGAGLIGARQRQARIQLLNAMVEQLLIDEKRARDTEAAAMNMQLVTWRDRAAADQAFIAGAGDALRTWRQP